MESTNALSRLADQPALDAVAEPLSQAIRGVYDAAGPAGRSAKNTVHGVWLGGVLVYGQRIGVTHAAVSAPESFTPVAHSADLSDNSMTRVRKDDADLLLVRQQGRVCALSHPCAHMGGPLSEGTLKTGSVICPWHGSQFGLEDGHVMNGPATQNQPCLDVRERAGEIEVKAREYSDGNR